MPITRGRARGCASSSRNYLGRFSRREREREKEKSGVSSGSDRFGAGGVRLQRSDAIACVLSFRRRLSSSLSLSRRMSSPRSSKERGSSPSGSDTFR